MLASPDPTPHERRTFLAALAVALVAFAWFVLRPLLAPMVLAVLIAVIVFPVYTWLRRRLAGRRLPAAVTTLGLLTAGVGAPAFGLLMLFVRQAQAVLSEVLGEAENRSRLAGLVEQLLEWLTQLAQATIGDAVDFGRIFGDSAQNFATVLYERLPDFFTRVGRFAFGIFLLYLVLFVLLLRGRALVDLFVELSPMGQEHSRRILRRLERTIKGMFLGTLAAALIQGIVGALGFWLVGFQNYLIWGVLLAGAGLIPVFGTGVVWVPAVIYLALAGETGAALWMLLVGAVVGSVDNLVKPLLIHERAEVHPLLVFVGLFGGLFSFGPMGLLYGPLLVACLVEMLRIYRDDFRPREGLEAANRGRALARRPVADGDPEDHRRGDPPAPD